ncbi:MAG: multidrug transporter AcrB [Hyphomicrobiales bacterium]|nr:MAG: multidrug transporter AcrB [Hyphomicrobiales bacterium]
MISEFCIKRPVFAIVLSLLIIVLGIASLMRVPIRELPDIDAAVVSITTTYVGAAPEIIDSDITEIIEGAIAGIAGVKSIASYSRRGRGRTVIEFAPGRNIDEAANDVRDAVARVRGKLPEDVDEPQIAKSDSDSDPVMRLSVTSDRMNAAQITDYADRFIVDRIATLDGVALVSIFGERRHAIRIWLDRKAMAARNLTVDDVVDALKRNNVELPAGELKSRTRQFTVRTKSRLSRPEAFRNIVLSRSEGFLTRLGDIAQVVRGIENDEIIVRSDGHDAVGIGILRQSQANTIAISRLVHAELARIRANLPVGMRVEVGSDDAIFIEASIREVLQALAIAIGLVVLVIFAFLASIRTTVIPAVTIPVAVIGAFIGIHFLGFSINVITLLALILAIGIIVDDAIVVLENIQRRIDSGEPPLVAGVRGARQVLFAVIATSLTLIAVFVPLSFMEGQIGRLFSEFGFVLAASVVISTFVALTLCPTLSTRLLRRTENPRLPTRLLEAAMSRLTAGYRVLLRAALAMPLVVLTLAALLGASSLVLYPLLPNELTPKEDRGVFFASITAPQGANVAYTDTQAAKAENVLKPLLTSGEATALFSLIGRRSQPHRSFIVVRLKHWDERTRNVQQIVREVRPAFSQITGARVAAVTPTGLGLRGSRTPLRVVVGGPDYESVQVWAQQLLERAEANPNLLNLEMDYEPNQPQFNLEINRAKADDLGIDVETIGRTLQYMLASKEVTTYIDRGREYPVIIQARAEDRQNPGDLANIFIRARKSGQLISLGAVASLKEGAAVPTLRRYDRLPSITISGSLAEGYALGTAIQFMQDAAADTLPSEANISFAGLSQKFLEAKGGMTVTFVLALVIVFLVLAAQFESFIHPLIIMLSVPLAFSGALFSLWVTGNSLNVYSQIGIILLIGLMAKNGILIVEFANQLRAEGKSVREAVVEGSVIRFRPILMTVISTIFGAVPLAVAAGAGAESRIAIGTVVIGGLGLASVLTLFVTPVLYDLLARYARASNAVALELESMLAKEDETTAPNM